MVYYICDKKACEECNNDGGWCCRTSKVEHAANFEKNKFGDYEEKTVAHAPNKSDNIVDLVKELNELCERYVQLRAIRLPYINEFKESQERLDEVLKAVEATIIMQTLKIKQDMGM